MELRQKDWSPMAMSGPKKIIEHGDDPATWRTDRGALHLRDGLLWLFIPAGCVLCANSDDPRGKTFQLDGPDEVYVCGVHGPLEKVDYHCKRLFQVSIGDVVTEGQESVDDFFLFPRSQDPAERSSFIRNLIEEARQYEASRDPSAEE